MADADADEVEGDAAPRDGTVHSDRMENVFVIFDAFCSEFRRLFGDFRRYSDVL